MKRRVMMLAVLGVLCVSAAGSMPPQDAAQPGPLAVLEPYIGGTWVSERAGRDGATVRTERTYAWTLGGRFVEVREKTGTAGGAAHYFAILGIDPATRRLTAWSFTSRGETFFMRRTDPPGEHLVFESFGEGGMWRMTIRLTGPGRFDEVTEVQRDSAWVPAGRQEFTRARE